MRPRNPGFSPGRPHLAPDPRRWPIGVFAAAAAPHCQVILKFLQKICGRPSSAGLGRTRIPLGGPKTGKSNPEGGAVSVSACSGQEDRLRACDGTGYVWVEGREGTGSGGTNLNAASHTLPNQHCWEAHGSQITAKSLISMVGAQGLEPWTR
jgi:hypothetical protein